MIFDMEEILEEVYAEFPDIQEGSIKKICRKGLFGIKEKLMKYLDVDLQLTINRRVKFFLPSTPEQQRTRIARRLYKQNKDEESSK